MRRRIRKTNANSAEQTPKVEIAPSNPKAKSAIAKHVYDLRLQTDAINLRMNGLLPEEIASALGITKAEVIRHIARGLEEYHADRNDVLHRYLALTNARYERYFRVWGPLASGYVEKVPVLDEHGIQLRDESGEPVVKDVIHPPDAEAMRLVARMMNDQNRMNGFNKVRVEHSGTNGVPISLDSNWSDNMTDEQLEKLSKAKDVGVVRGLLGRSGPGASRA